jgi:hypothetical protein
MVAIHVCTGVVVGANRGSFQRNTGEHAARTRVAEDFGSHPSIGIRGSVTSFGSSGATGGMPPRGNNTERMQLCGLSKARPISCSDCPAFHRLQTSRFSIAESPNRYPGLMPTPPYTQQTYIRWCCIDPSNAPVLMGPITRRAWGALVISLFLIPIRGVKIV